jgi:hypothetical protein
VYKERKTRCLRISVVLALVCVAIVLGICDLVFSVLLAATISAFLFAVFGLLLPYIQVRYGETTDFAYRMVVLGRRTSNPVGSQSRRAKATATTHGLMLAGSAEAQAARRLGVSQVWWLQRSHHHAASELLSVARAFCLLRSVPAWKGYPTSSCQESSLA